MAEYKVLGIKKLYQILMGTWIKMLL